jgi:hypothetical protein
MVLLACQMYMRMKQCVCSSKKWVARPARGDEITGKINMCLYCVKSKLNGLSIQIASLNFLQKTPLRFSVYNNVHCGLHLKYGCSQMLLIRSKFVPDYRASRGSNTSFKNQNRQLEGTTHILLNTRWIIIIIIIIMSQFQETGMWFKKKVRRFWNIKTLQ